MPAVHSCNPADYGRTYNAMSLTVTGGATITVRWNWDGVSVYPNCDGPLVDGGSGQDRWAVRVVNPTANTYYAHTENKEGEWKTWTLNPGQTVTVTATQAANNGYALYSDFYDLTLTTTP